MRKSIVSAEFVEVFNHGDGVDQDVSGDFRDMCEDCGITASMSRRRNVWGDVRSETLFGSLKVMRLHGQCLIVCQHRRCDNAGPIRWRPQ